MSKSILDPTYVPGEDWTHRIDAVPQPYRNVEVKLIGSPNAADATPFRAFTRPAPREFGYQGIGGDIAYDLVAGKGASTLCSAGVIAFWRYI